MSREVRQCYSHVQVIAVGSVDMVCGNGTAGFPHGEAVLISTAGNLVIDTLGGETSITIPVPVGEFKIGSQKIYHSGTTAAGSVLY